MAVSSVLSSDAYNVLLQEHETLSARLLNKTITPEQCNRLTEVEAELDAIELCSPEWSAIQRELLHTDQRLDELLRTVEALPDKRSEQVRAR